MTLKETLAKLEGISRALGSVRGGGLPDGGAGLAASRGEEVFRAEDRLQGRDYPACVLSE